MADEKRVAGYDDPVQEPEELILKTLEYRMPFNYRNVTVHRQYHGGEVHGVELFPINTDTKGSSGLPPEFIEVEEQHPIVRVAVIGSACTPPGWIQIEADPVEGFRGERESPEVMPVRFRADNLWGMHFRYDSWKAKGSSQIDPVKGAEHYPDSLPGGTKPKLISRELPLTGMSCAIFEIPPSDRVRITGGGQIPAWTADNFPDDVHYSFRMIRTTLSVKA